MRTFLQQLLIGLTNGWVVALIALGYSLVFGVLALINMAHGDVFMLAALFALSLLAYVPQPTTLLHAFVLVVVLAALSAMFAAIVAYALERFAFRPVRNRHPMAPLVAALGASLVLQNVGLLWGALPISTLGGGSSAAAPKAFPTLIAASNLLPDSWGILLSWRDVAVMGAAIAALLLLVVVVHSTSLGRAMRATAQDPLAATLMGIDTHRVIGYTFALGGALAGMGSVMYGLYVGTVHYQMGAQTGLYAFVAAVVGGIGSLGGAVLGGLLIGVVRALSDQYVGAQWQPAVLFGLLIVVLVVRPTGLIGSRTQEKV